MQYIFLFLLCLPKTQAQQSLTSIVVTECTDEEMESEGLYCLNDGVCLTDIIPPPDNIRHSYCTCPDSYVGYICQRRKPPSVILGLSPTQAPVNTSVIIAVVIGAVGIIITLIVVGTVYMLRRTPQEPRTNNSELQKASRMLGGRQEEERGLPSPRKEAV